EGVGGGKAGVGGGKNCDLEPGVLDGVVGPDEGDARGAVDAGSGLHGDGLWSGSGGPIGGQVMGGGFEGEVCGRGRSHGAGGVDEEAVDAAGVAGVVGEGGDAAGEEGGFVGGDGVVVGDEVEVGVVVEEEAAGDGAGGCELAFVGADVPRGAAGSWV